MGKLVEEGKINEMSPSIKIPPLNCRLCETGRMPQGCAAAHCQGQGLGMRIMILGENDDLVHLNFYCYVLLSFSITLSFMAVHTQTCGEPDQ